MVEIKSGHIFLTFSGTATDEFFLTFHRSYMTYETSTEFFKFFLNPIRFIKNKCYFMSSEGFCALEKNVQFCSLLATACNGCVAPFK
jgi:hypothetical protein